jgi:hypothetical protein
MLVKLRVGPMTGHLLFGHNDGHYAGIYRKHGHNAVIMDIMFFAYKMSKIIKNEQKSIGFIRTTFIQM